MNLSEIDILKFENEAMKQLLANGFYCVNWYSTDCDGCSSQSHKKYESLSDFWDAVNIKIEWADGPWWFNIVPVGGELAEEHSAGYWGM